FLFWKSKLLKNKVLISELTNVYSKNTLIEYIALLSNLVINYGYPCQDVYAIKKKIYATIEQSNSDPINIEILNQIICLFFDLLLNETYSSEIEGFQKIKYHIDRNITQSLTLSDIARNLHMPLKELNPLFKSKYNITINQYIRRKKIDISKSLLYATNLSFQDIATFVGFNSQSYFITTFKAIVEQTPSDYRKCNKKQNLV
ncbi:helix-turn-helix domain-containing protein, partial [Leuconostoc mesenteroides]|uniref:helix-turn-helix domain-containing protein n=5 Tax=Leuconostoc mesenteroides TaxID=1245 RepID=UPI000A8097D1